MKKFYPAILACLIIVCSCQREVNEKLDEGLKPSDAVAMSKAIRVWHGVRTNGSMPAPTTNPASPQLDPSTDNEQLKAIAGRYTIIFPAIISGEVAGYYVTVSGASEYFKVDYTRPRITERRRPTRAPGLNSPNAALRVDTVSAVDSAIVIIIPANIQPGTFCISYCAYDSNGNISNVITNCITVSLFGGDATTSYLGGTWRFDAERWDSTDTWIPFDYTPYVETDSFYCNPDTVNGGYNYDDHCYSASCNVFYDTSYYYQTVKDDMILAVNGGLRYEYREEDRTIVYYGPACSNAPMEDWGYSDLVDGAWSYNPSGTSLILIFDLNQWGFPDPEVYEFKLIKESNTQIILQDPLDGYQYRLKKQ